MARIIHARLDPGTERIMAQVARRTGWNDSRIIREGINALGALLPPNGRRTIVGVGRFRSGKPDLGSNRRHLEGFGR